MNLIGLRWQNILAIWIMVIALGFVGVAMGQGARRFLPTGEG